MGVLTYAPNRLPHTNDDFKAAAESLLKGKSMREWARLTGVSHTRISDMLFGVVPSYRLLERFAEQVLQSGVGVPKERVAALFLAAGWPVPLVVEQAPNVFVSVPNVLDDDYEPDAGGAESASEPSEGYAFFLDNLARIYAEHGRDVLPMSLLEKVARNISVTQAKETLAVIERQLAEGTL